VARHEGDYATALDLYREVIVSWQRIGNRGAIARNLECLAFMAWRQTAGSNAPNVEGLQRAARLFGSASALREESGSPMNSDERAEYERAIADLRAAWVATPKISIDVAWNAGRALSMAQAVAYAIENPAPAPQAPNPN
jgi:hypothetical protein